MNCFVPGELKLSLPKKPFLNTVLLFFFVVPVVFPWPALLLFNQYCHPDIDSKTCSTPVNIKDALKHNTFTHETGAHLFTVVLS